MVKGLCERVVEVTSATDRVMAIVFVIEEGVLRIIYGYSLHEVRSLREKESLLMS